MACSGLKLSKALKDSNNKKNPIKKLVDLASDIFKYIESVSWDN